jgi:hypothetical protein
MFGAGAENIIMLMNAWTGSEFISLLMIVIFIMVLGLAFGLPLEWTIIFIMPMLIAYMAVNAAFYPAGAVLLLYLSFVLAKYFMIK